MTLLFWLVRSKRNSAGTAPIYARVTINGRRAEVATGIRCNPQHWNHPRQQIKGRDPQVASHNARLQHISSQLYEIYYDLQRQKLPTTAGSIKRAYLAPGIAQLSLMETVDRYVTYQKDIKKVATNTWKSYQARRYNVELFLKHTRRGNLSLAEVSLRHANELYEYLLTERTVANSYAVTIVKFCKSVLDFAVSQELAGQNAFEGFRGEKSTKKPIVSLNAEELHALRTLKNFTSLTNKQYVSLTCFLAQCYTSLAYADLMNLSEDYITLDLEQRPWIVMKRQKTGKLLKLPLLRQAQQLLQPLNYHLPRISCASYNYHLQSLASKAGITKHISSHVGRKTYGNIARAAGVSLEMIGEVYSHSDTRTTRAHYVDTLPEGLYEQMDNIRF